MNFQPHQPVVVIIGPTAAGKSKIAMELCRKFNGEIVSADSMQIYRGMDIGTAKPSRKDQKIIRHHLIDILPPSKAFSVFEFHQRALEVIQAISRRGKLPVIVGGTGLYVRALLHGFTKVPGKDPKFRKKIENEIKKNGLESVYAKLSSLAPDYAKKIQPNDQRRIIRLLEILEKTGGDLSDYEKNQGALTDFGYAPIVLGIQCDREALYHAVEQRVDQMFKKGLFNEASGLYKKRISLTASQALGYKEIWESLDRFKKEKRSSLTPTDHETLKSLIQRNTRHFAKRQLTWFKKEKGIEWVSCSVPVTLPEIKRIEVLLEKKLDEVPLHFATNLS